MMIDVMPPWSLGQSVRCKLSVSWLCQIVFVLCLVSSPFLVDAHLRRIYKSVRDSEQVALNKSEGRKFPILRAIVSQLISDRSSRDTSPIKDVALAIDEASKLTAEATSLAMSASTVSVLTSSLPSTNSVVITSFDQTDKVKGTNNIKSIQNIIEDINSQNSQISTKRRKNFLVNILSRMLKSVNFNKVQ